MAASTTAGTTQAHRKQAEHDATRPLLQSADALSGDAREALRLNYASPAMNAKIIHANPDAKLGSKGDWVLSESTDSYTLSPCASDRWLVIELAQNVLVDSLVLEDYEMHASRVRDFSVFTKISRPTLLRGVAPDLSPDSTEWHHRGTFTARNKHSEPQTFDLDEPVVARYVLIRFDSHWGGEVNCCLSVLRIIGIGGEDLVIGTPSGLETETEIELDRQEDALDVGEMGIERTRKEIGTDEGDGLGVEADPGKEEEEEEEEDGKVTFLSARAVRQPEDEAVGKGSEAQEARRAEREQEKEEMEKEKKEEDETKTVAGEVSKVAYPTHGASSSPSSDVVSSESSSATSTSTSSFPAIRTPSTVPNGETQAEVNALSSSGDGAGHEGISGGSTRATAPIDPDESRPAPPLSSSESPTDTSRMPEVGRIPSDTQVPAASATGTTAGSYADAGAGREKVKGEWETGEKEWETDVIVEMEAAQDTSTSTGVHTRTRTSTVDEDDPSRPRRRSRRGWWGLRWGRDAKVEVENGDKSPPRPTATTGTTKVPTEVKREEQERWASVDQHDDHEKDEKEEPHDLPISRTVITEPKVSAWFRWWWSPFSSPTTTIPSNASTTPSPPNTKPSSSTTSSSSSSSSPFSTSSPDPTSVPVLASSSPDHYVALRRAIQVAIKLELRRQGQRLVRRLETLAATEGLDFFMVHDTKSGTRAGEKEMERRKARTTRTAPAVEEGIHIPPRSFYPHPWPGGDHHHHHHHHHQVLSGGVTTIPIDAVHHLHTGDISDTVDMADSDSPDPDSSDADLAEVNPEILDADLDPYPNHLVLDLEHDLDLDLDLEDDENLPHPLPTGSNGGEHSRTRGESSSRSTSHHDRSGSGNTRRRGRSPSILDALDAADLRRVLRVLRHVTNGDSTTPASSVRVTSWLLVLHSMTSLALVALVAATVARGGGWYPPTSTTFLFPWAKTTTTGSGTRPHPSPSGTWMASHHVEEDGTSTPPLMMTPRRRGEEGAGVGKGVGGLDRGGGTGKVSGSRGSPDSTGSLTPTVRGGVMDDMGDLGDRVGRVELPSRGCVRGEGWSPTMVGQVPGWIGPVLIGLATVQVGVGLAVQVRAGWN